MIQWSRAGQPVTNSSQLTIRQFRGMTRTSVTSVLQINVVTAAFRGVYQCKAVNKGGQAVDTRSLVVDHDIMDQLVKLKLYVMAGVGGCIVLLSSLIAASCIYHVRSKESELQSCKYSHHSDSWCHSDSGDFSSDSRPLFRFSLRERSVGGEEDQEGSNNYQLVPSSSPVVRRLAVLQEAVQEAVTSPSDTNSSSDSGVSLGQDRPRQVRCEVTSHHPRLHTTVSGSTVSQPSAWNTPLRARLRTTGRRAVLLVRRL